MKIPRKWKLWSKTPPTEIGVYWLAGWFPEQPNRLNQPIIWELDAHDLTHDPVSIHAYIAENLLWQGPIIFEQGPDIEEVDL